ncbi:hypothetical protein FHQ08_12600 [Lactobacillus sp. CC-MHH1034]|uniref:hypothetical protein n=1 Tax=Agrilactobacillus fermenti TaxID=2586909 RepID=UPI001E375579|nr:hypothetical protein [Agrilactobacillus fermenti]MCD2257526.1 hypothetical protein [Agrilactobacillus fermenti]
MSELNLIEAFLSEHHLDLMDYSAATQEEIQQKLSLFEIPGNIERLSARFLSETALLLQLDLKSAFLTLHQFEATAYLAKKINYHNRINDLPLQETIQHEATHLVTGLKKHQQTQLLLDLYPFVYTELEAGHYHNLRVKLATLYDAADLPQPILYEDTFKINKNEYINIWILLLMTIIKQIN